MLNKIKKSFNLNNCLISQASNTYYLMRVFNDKQIEINFCEVKYLKEL